MVQEDLVVVVGGGGWWHYFFRQGRGVFVVLCFCSILSCHGCELQHCWCSSLRAAVRCGYEGADSKVLACAVLCIIKANF